MFRNLFILLAAACLLRCAGVAQSGAKLGVTVRKASAQSASVSAGAATSSPFTAYDFNWQYVANLPQCVTTNLACFDGFILTNTTTGAVVATESQIGPTALSYTYTPAGGIPYGTVNFSLVAHGFDQNGTALTSSPATVAVTVAVTSLNGPTNLQGKTQ